MIFLDDLRKGILRGDYQDTLSEIEKLKNESPDYLILKQLIFEILGNYSASTKIANKVIKIKGVKSHQLALTLTFSALSYCRIGNFRQAKKKLNQAEEYKHKINSKSNKEQNLFLAAWYSFTEGEINRETGNLKLAENRFKKSLDYFSQINDDFGITRSKRNLGAVHIQKGKLNEALENYNSAMKMAKQNKDKYNQALIYNSLGLIYWNKRDLKKSLENYVTSLKLFEKIGNQIEISVVKINIGSIYYEYYNFKKSKQYMLESLSYYDSIKHYLNSSYILYYLIKIALIEENEKELDDYYSKLLKLCKKSNSKYISLHKDMSEALIFYQKNTLITKVKCLNILNGIINHNIFHYEFYLIALKLKCEILLDDYELYKDQSILDEFNYCLSEIEKISKKQDYQLSKIDSLTLQARLSILNGDYDNAELLLNKAENQAQDLGLTITVIQTKLERIAFNEKIQNILKIVEQNANVKRLQDQFLSSEFESSKERIPQYSQNQSNFELPILFLVTNIGGVLLLMYEFEKQLITNPHLVSSMVTALNSFVKESFSVTSDLERIKHREFTILFKFINNLIFCYVYKNESIGVNKRFNSLIHLVMKRRKLMDKLTAEIYNGDTSIDDEFENEIIDIFMKK